MEHTRIGSRRLPVRTLIACGVGVWAAAIAAAGESGGQTSQAIATPQPRAVRIDYQRQIQPILAERCLECHSQDKRKGGLSLATYADVLEGGKDGAVVRPGNSANSLLVHRVVGDVEPRMPKDELPLADAEIALIRSWIDDGARATPGGPAAPAPWEAPLALDRPAIPAAVWTGWNAPIDRFVSAYLSRRGQKSSAIPDARFARRAYLDVWGLLPTPERASRVRVRSGAGQAREARRVAPRGLGQVRRSLDLVLERSPAQ